MTNLIKKIIELNKQTEAEIKNLPSKIRHAFLEKVEAMIEEALKEDPTNIELWLRLAILEQTTPLYDIKKAISTLEHALTLDKNNVIATLLLAYIRDLSTGDIGQELANKLCSLHADSNELNAMLKCAASWHYHTSEPNDLKQEEQLLKESISLYDGHVWNYVYLARLYFAQNRAAEAKPLAEKALKNVTKVYNIFNYNDDITDIDEFLNAYIKGTYQSMPNFEDIQKLINR